MRISIRIFLLEYPFAQRKLHMTNNAKKELKSVFESFVADIEKKFKKYFNITRKQNYDEPSSNIAFEMSNIFKLARETLPIDPSNPYGLEAFEKEYYRIRSSFFPDPDSSED